MINHRLVALLVLAAVSATASAGSEMRVSKAPLTIYSGPKSSPTVLVTLPGNTVVSYTRDGKFATVRPINGSGEKGWAPIEAIYAAFDARTEPGATLAPGHFRAEAVGITSTITGMKCERGYDETLESCTVSVNVSVLVPGEANATGMISCTEAVAFRESASGYFASIEPKTGDMFVIVRGGAGMTSLEVKVPKPSYPGSEYRHAELSDGACRVETMERS